mmetsp:Transcript_41804/g.97891  ORF Transcript_41804/g.97891 Transcript_41804/m.97891 type:complete len:293 (+) Transcript_41804:864-1742(+)
MLRRQICAEFDVRVLPLARVLGHLLLQHANGLGIRDAREGLLDERQQLLAKSLLDEFTEELQVVAALVERVLDRVLDVRLGVVHVVAQIGEGHLGLDHPELGEVPCRVGVFRAERRAECVHIAQSASVRLGGELPRHREVRRAPEEVVGEGLRRGGALLGRRRPLRIDRQRGHAEHLSRPLAVTRGEQRRVHVLEALRVEELVRRVCQRRAHACDGAEHVGARAQVSNRAEKLEGVALLLQGVGVCRALAHELQRRRLHFDHLPGGGRLDHLAVHRHGCACRQLVDDAVGVD